MGKRLTPEGASWAETLAAIRKGLEDQPDGPLRPEELAMLEDWYASCEDPDQRQRLGQIMRVLGRGN